jgi:hypothetical protein
MMTKTWYGLLTAAALALWLCGCASLPQEQDLVRLASNDGRYVVSITSYNEKTQIASIQIQGLSNVKMEGVVDEFITTHYKFNGTTWEPCKTPVRENP